MSFLQGAAVEVGKSVGISPSLRFVDYSLCGSYIL